MPVAAAAALYYQDMYVNVKLVMETASWISSIRLWVTNEYMHLGLCDAGRQVLDHFWGMINGKKKASLLMISVLIICSSHWFVSCGCGFLVYTFIED